MTRKFDCDVDTCFIQDATCCKNLMQVWLLCKLWHLRGLTIWILLGRKNDISPHRLIRFRHLREALVEIEDRFQSSNPRKIRQNIRRWTLCPGYGTGLGGLVPHAHRLYMTAILFDNLTVNNFSNRHPMISRISWP